MKIPIKSQLKNKAIKYSQDVTDYNKSQGFHRDLCPNSNVDHMGWIAQFHILDYLGLPLPHELIPDKYDLVYNKMRIDVKCVKYYNAYLIVPDYLREKDITHYLLTRYDEKEEFIQIYGIISKKEFMLKATYNEHITPHLKSKSLRWIYLNPFKKEVIL